MSILCAGAFSSSPLLSMGTIIVSFPGYLSYREKCLGTRTCIEKCLGTRTGGWGERGKIRMAREARKSRKYEGQLTKPIDR